VEKAWQYAYRDRRRKKREWRKLWIQRVQAGCRQYNYRYSAFFPALGRANIALNRKVLSELAANEPFTFKAIVDVVEHHQFQHCNSSTDSDRDYWKQDEAA
jgi:large subunit ribosomal protein L20